MVGQTNRGFGTLQGEESTGTTFQTGKGGTKTENAGIAGMAETVKDKAEELASSASQRAEELWDSTRQGMQRATHAVADTAEDAFANLTSTMRRYPFATLAAGFALGFLVAQAMSFSRGESRSY